MRADWPIVAAVWLITVLSAVLFSAGVIYPAAAAEAGLQRALRDAPASSRSLEVARYEDAPNVATMDEQVTNVLQNLIAGPGGSIVRDWRGSATLALDPHPGVEKGDQAEVGFLDGIEEHATLVAGAWPQGIAGAGTVPDVVDVAVAETAAGTLGLQVGDEIGAISHPGSQQTNEKLRIVGIYAPQRSGDPYWNGDEPLLTGEHQNATYTTYGPFLTSREALLALLTFDELDLRWRVFPDFDRLAVDDAGPLARNIDAIAPRLLNDTHAEFSVNSELAGILREAERSLLVSRTSVVLLMAQLALLAGYAIVLMATLLVDHRRVDTSLLRARGAGSRHVAALSLVEAGVFAGTAIAVGPTLAAAAVGVFNVVGPLAEVGLQLQPRITSEAYVAAAAAGLLCIALLVLPAALSARAFAQEQGGKSRQETRTFGQRLGLDVVLIAITGIALWQLRLYGAPLTRSVQGQLGLDPLLVAAPAIGLVAGGVLALRLLPLIAQIAEATVARGRGLLSSLGARQLARRPLRYTRSALLLVLSVSMGVFALSYAATWAGSQRDQATYQAGADLRVPAAASKTGTPTWALAGALADLAGVAGTTPVERINEGIRFAATGNADLIALDAATAGDIVLLRDDAVSTPLGTMLQPLVAGRPAPRLPPLPDGSAYLRITPAATITKVQEYRTDPQTGSDSFIDLDPSAVAIDMRASVVVRDSHGLTYGFRSAIERVTTGQGMVVPLRPPGDGADLHLDGPLSLVQLGVEIYLPENTITSRAAFGVAAVGASAAEAGPWTDVATGGAGPWSATRSFGHNTPEDVPGASVDGVTINIDEGEGEFAGFFGNGTFQPTTILGFLPNGIDATGGALKAIVNQAFLDTFDGAVGDTVSVTIGDRFTRLEIAGAMATFPTTDPKEPLAIVDEATLSLLRLRTTVPTRPVDEWWISAQPGQAEALAAAIEQAPFQRPDVVSATGRTRQLSTDPVALGIIGALTLGFVTTGLFAIVGLTVSAGVSARQQRGEFALLRALGLSGRQLSGSLWLEHGSVVVLGLVAGTALGLVISWLVLPFVTVTQGGVTPVPSVLIEVPWDRVLVLNLVSGGALAVAVLVIGSVLRRLRVGATLRMGEE